MADDTPIEVESPPLHQHQQQQQGIRLWARAFVSSWIWNFLVGVAIIADITFIVLFHQHIAITVHQRFLLSVIDLALLACLLFETLLRFISSGFINFFLANKNRIIVLLTLLVAGHFVIFDLQGQQNDLFEGMLMGVLLIRLFWVVPVTLSKQSFAFNDATSSSEPIAVRCVYILDRVKCQITNGLDIDASVCCEDLDFVSNCIASNTLYQSSLDISLRGEEIDPEQSSFLRMTFTDNSPQPVRGNSGMSQRRHSAMSVQSDDTPNAKTTDDSGIAKVMSDVCEWHFDVFAATSLSHNKPLQLVAHHVFAHLQLPTTFQIADDVLVAWLKKVEEGYKPNPYHSATHAADVVQCTFYMLARTGLLQLLSDIEVFAVIIAAVIHDYGHVGFTNVFLKLSSHQLALRYNDQSILENFHASEGWQLCIHPSHNIFASLKPDQFRNVRDLVLDLVLNTDMARHSAHSRDFAKGLAQGLDMSRAEDRLLVLRSLLHVADLSNGARNGTLSQKWSRCVMDEFFNQGDSEKQRGLAVSPNMDRDGGDEAVAKCQLTFLQYVIKPLFKDWCCFLRQYCPSDAKLQAERSTFLFETHINLNMEFWEKEYHRLCPAAAQAAIEQRKSKPKTPLFAAANRDVTANDRSMNRLAGIPKLVIDRPVSKNRNLNAGSPTQNFAIEMGSTVGVSPIPELKSKRSRSLQPRSMMATPIRLTSLDDADGHTPYVQIP